MKKVEISQSERCVKCGSCLHACPVFEAGGLESFAPRGKMALIESLSKDQVDETSVYREYIETCLLCGACGEACPNEVQTLPLMLKAREELAEHKGVGVGKGLVLKYLIGAARTFKVAMKTGWFMQQVMFRRIPESSGLNRRFPMPLVAEGRTVPPVARYFFTELFDGVVREGYGPRVGIFAGCMTNYFYPEVGEGMVNLLGTLGATVIVPEEQVCCGMPALTGGASETVHELAVKNLEIFEKWDLDYIVTGCASCGGNLKDNYAGFLEEAGIEPERIERFAGKVMDINEFMVSTGLAPGEKLDQRSGGEGLKVTYHHPCHLGRLQGIKEEPIQMLQCIPGVEYTPMEDADRCCGMGGSFSLTYYDLAKEVSDQKVERIVESGADCVATSCPACIMHMRDGLRRKGRDDIKVVHVMELMARHLAPSLAARYEAQNGASDDNAAEDEARP
jgi:glycolate oxidase iron-sulfur subunit